MTITLPLNCRSALRSKSAWSAYLCLGWACLSSQVVAQEPAVQAQLEELRQSNQALQDLLMQQQARMDALERRVGQAPAPAAGGAPAYSSKNVYSAKAPLDDVLPPPDPEPNFIQMKRSGDDSSLLQVYGFARLDAIYDDDQAGLDELLGFAESDDLDPESDDFYLHPKLSRIGVDFNGPSLDLPGGPKLTGKVEVDFYRQFETSESRAEFRMRHAWLRLDWDEWYLLGGQTFDTISPLYPAINPDAGAWGMGNLGDRRPQFIVGYTPSVGDATLSFVGAVGQSGANSSSQGEDNPTYQGRIAYKRPLFGGDFELGVWGHYADEDGFDSDAYGLDVTLPLGPVLALQGEIWQGKNLDDVRGGIWQSGVNLLGDEIGSEGGWVELMWKVNDWFSVHGGYMLDNPDNSDLETFAVAPNQSRAKNETFYGALRFNFDPLLFGFDYIHLETDYLGARRGSVNRFQSYLQYNF